MVPVPDRMKHLPLDRRGYPVPVIVAVKDGVPAFSVNDVDITHRMVAEDRCSICGTKLFRGRWLVGGCLSALACDGVFADAPVHDECVHYALQACPYLAAPNWRTPIGRLQHAQMGLPGLAFDIEKTDPARPEAFIAVMASRIDIESRGFGVVFCRPKEGHVIRAEAWKNGGRLDGGELAAFLDRARLKVEQHSPLRTDIWRALHGEG